MTKSFDEYCELCDLYETYAYRCDDWFPTKDEVDYLLDTIDDNYKLIVWILETASDAIKEQYESEYSYFRNSFEEVVDFE